MMNRQMRRQARRQQEKSQGQAPGQQSVNLLQQMQEELESMTTEGSAGGGVVKVVMSGKQVVESVEIAPEAVEDVELLQDLIIAAVNDALNKSQQMASEKLSTLTGGMNIPGLT